MNVVEVPYVYSNIKSSAVIVTVLIEAYMTTPAESVIVLCHGEIYHRMSR